MTKIVLKTVSKNIETRTCVALARKFSYANSVSQLLYHIMEIVTRKDYGVDYGGAALKIISHLINFSQFRWLEIFHLL